MAVMDGLKNKWNQLQEVVEQRRQESMKSLDHSQLPLNDPQVPGGERTPLERFHPAGAEAAKGVEEWRKNQPEEPKKEVPTSLKPQPVGPGYGNGPTVAQPGVEYGKALPARENNQSQPAAPPSIRTDSAHSPEPTPHERLAAKLDKATDNDLRAVAQQRSETIRNLDRERGI